MDEINLVYNNQQLKDSIQFPKESINASCIWGACFCQGAYLSIGDD